MTVLYCIDLGKLRYLVLIRLSPLGVGHGRGVDLIGSEPGEPQVQLCMPGDVCALCSCPFPAGVQAAIPTFLNHPE